MAKVLLTLALVAMVAIPPFTTNFGKETVGLNGGAPSANEMLSTGPYTLASSGTLNSCSLYSAISGGHYTIGVYTDSGAAPNTLVGNSADATTVIGTFVTSSVSGSVSAADYWIAVNFADGTPVITYDADGPQSFLGTNTYSAGSLPGTYPGGGSSADRTYSMYCTYTASGGGSSFIPAIINAPKRGGGFHALRRR